MGAAFLHGGSGGTSLNFKVVGGLTQPANPQENTIWVSTDVKITDWTFSAEAPEKPSEGSVWFLTGTSSEVSFNALKKNGLQIYPISAKQYIGGEWVEKSVKSYQGGAWVEWISTVYLYNTGDECTDITGGWVAKALKRPDQGSAAEPTVTKNTDNLFIKGKASNGGVVHTQNKINLSGKKKLEFDGTLTPASAGGVWVMIGVWSDFGSTFMDNLAASYQPTNTVTGKQTIDISELDGNYYIGFATYGTSSAEMDTLLVE